MLLCLHAADGRDIRTIMQTAAVVCVYRFIFGFNLFGKSLMVPLGNAN